MKSLHRVGGESEMECAVSILVPGIQVVQGDLVGYHVWKDIKGVSSRFFVGGMFVADCLWKTHAVGRQIGDDDDESCEIVAGERGCDDVGQLIAEIRLVSSCRDSD